MFTRRFIAFSLLVSLYLASCGTDDHSDIENPPAEVPPFDEGGNVWLRGDFHVHSSHSNDAAENHIDEIVDHAQNTLGMDFFVVTDHDNHLDGDMTESWEDPAFTDHDMTLLYGAEYTTAFGHACVLGLEPWDHPALYALRDEQENGEAIVSLAHEMGLHFSINHPTGKDLWEFDFDIGYDSMEVWNAPWTFPNPAEKNLELWDAQVRELERRIPIRGGSDCHHYHDHPEAEINNIGNPTTWLYASENSPEAILEALASGRASVSFAPHGERVAIWADGDLDGAFETVMGDALPEATGETIRLGVEIGNAEAGVERTIEVYSHASPLVPVASLTTTRLRETIDLPAIDGRGYYRVQLRGELQGVGVLLRGLGSRVLSISNPIYAGY